MAKITENFVLPRTVPLASLLAGAGGTILGVILGVVVSAFLPIDPFTAILLCAIVFGGGGIAVVQWQPWRGESVTRVVTVRTKFFAGTKTVSCPGVGRAAVHDHDLGCDICPHCRLVIEVDDMGVTPEHNWRRRLYVGMVPVGEPETGAVRMVIGSLPVHRPSRPVEHPE